MSEKSPASKLVSAAWRVDELVKIAGDGSGGLEAALPDVLEELQNTLHELVIAEERLRLRNEELSATVRVLEAKQARNQEMLRQREAELAHFARLSTMGEMAAGIAHELNQPLSAIMNFADAGKRKLHSGTGDAGELTHSLERITSMAERAGRIIGRLKNLACKRESNRSTVDLNELVREVVGLVASEARLAGVEIHLELDNQLPHLIADSIQIQQVILNLVRNGTEAMHGTETAPHQLVIRTARSEGGIVEVAITDTGPGLAP